MTDAELALLALKTPGTDCLDDHGLHEEARLLTDAPAKAALLERAVALLEDIFHDRSIILSMRMLPMVPVIAEHRGETPQATLARLMPPTNDLPEGYTIDELGLAHSPETLDELANLPVRAPEPVQIRREPRWHEVIDGVAYPEPDENAFAPPGLPGPPMTRNADGTFRPWREGDPPATVVMMRRGNEFTEDEMRDWCDTTRGARRATGDVIPEGPDRPARLSNREWTDLFHGPTTGAGPDHRE